MICSDYKKSLILFEGQNSAESQIVASSVLPKTCGESNMRKISILAAMAVAGMVVGFQSAHAGLLGMPMGLKSAIQRIKFEAPTLPPMAYSQFCVRYEDECRSRPMFRGGPIRLTDERWADLKEINQTVNQDIIPERNELGLAGET